MPVAGNDDFHGGSKTFSCHTPARPEQVWAALTCCRPNQATPPVYLTWLIRPTRAGCMIRLHIDVIDAADSAEDAEDTWLPILAALQQQAAGPTTDQWWC